MRTKGLIFLFGVDGLYLLLCFCQFVFQLLHTAVHIVDKAIALLATDIEEAEFFFLSVYLLLQLLEATHKASAFVVDSIFATLCNLLQVVAEVVHTATRSLDV